MIDVKTMLQQAANEQYMAEFAGQEAARIKQAEHTALIDAKKEGLVKSDFFLLTTDALQELHERSMWALTYHVDFDRQAKHAVKIKVEAEGLPKTSCDISLWASGLVNIGNDVWQLNQPLFDVGPFPPNRMLAKPATTTGDAELAQIVVKRVADGLVNRGQIALPEPDLTIARPALTRSPEGRSGRDLVADELQKLANEKELARLEALRVDQETKLAFTGHPIATAYRATLDQLAELSGGTYSYTETGRNYTHLIFESKVSGYGSLSPVVLTLNGGVSTQRSRLTDLRIERGSGVGAPPAETDDLTRKLCDNAIEEAVQTRTVQLPKHNLPKGVLEVQAPSPDASVTDKLQWRSNNIELAARQRNQAGRELKEFKKVAFDDPLVVEVSDTLGRLHDQAGLQLGETRFALGNIPSGNAIVFPLKKTNDRGTKEYGAVALTADGTVNYIDLNRSTIVFSVSSGEQLYPPRPAQRLGNHDAIMLPLAQAIIDHARAQKAIALPAPTVTDDLRAEAGGRASDANPDLSNS